MLGRQFPDAVESAPTVMGKMPPDRQGMTLGEHLRAALAMMQQDRVLSPDEMREVAAFMQGTKMLAEGRMAQGKTAAGGEPAEPEAPMGDETGDYMSHAGEEKYPQEV